MKYDLSKHSLIEDNGELVAFFAPNFRADKAFEIADNINDWKNIPDLESNIDILDHEKRLLDKEIDELNDKTTDLKAEVNFQKNQLDEIYDAVTEEYSKEEMVEVIKAICLRK